MEDFKKGEIKITFEIKNQMAHDDWENFEKAVKSDLEQAITHIKAHHTDPADYPLNS